MGDRRGGRWGKDQRVRVHNNAGYVEAACRASATGWSEIKASYIGEGGRVADTAQDACQIAFPDGARIWYALDAVHSDHSNPLNDMSETSEPTPPSPTKPLFTKLPYPATESRHRHRGRRRSSSISCSAKRPPSPTTASPVLSVYIALDDVPLCNSPSLSDRNPSQRGPERGDLVMSRGVVDGFLVTPGGAYLPLDSRDGLPLFKKAKWFGGQPNDSTLEASSISDVQERRTRKVITMDKSTGTDVFDAPEQQLPPPPPEPPPREEHSPEMISVAHPPPPAHQPQPAHQPPPAQPPHTHQPPPPAHQPTPAHQPPPHPTPHPAPVQQSDHFVEGGGVQLTRQVRLRSGRVLAPGATGLVVKVPGDLPNSPAMVRVDGALFNLRHGMGIPIPPTPNRLIEVWKQRASTAEGEASRLRVELTNLHVSPLRAMSPSPSPVWGEQVRAAKQEWHVGEECLGLWEGSWHPCTVAAVSGDGKVDVTWWDGTGSRGMLSDWLVRRRRVWAHGEMAEGLWEGEWHVCTIDTGHPDGSADVRWSDDTVTLGMAPEWLKEFGKGDALPALHTLHP